MVSCDAVGRHCADRPTKKVLMMDYYPRPQFKRDSWLSLDGHWDFAFDDDHRRTVGQWLGGDGFDRTIIVPFAFQCPASGIGDTSTHDSVWYHRRVSLAAIDADIIRLHIGASDYRTSVWVNGAYCGHHDGGFTPFSFDIQDHLGDDRVADIVMHVEDRSADPGLPRGKQTFTGRSEGIFYTNTTGIWQPVWAEGVSADRLESVRFIPDTLTNSVRVETELVAGHAAQLHVVIRRGDETVIDDLSVIDADGQPATQVRLYDIPDFNDHHYGHWWNPDSPNLYDVTLELIADGTVTDRVESYFGMRTVSIENGTFCLNHMPFTTKAVLYQGYYPDSLMTARDDRQMRHDVELIKAMGFNAVRLHQKYENPRLLYWCDRLGLAVWGEAPNAYSFSVASGQALLREWQQILRRDADHPSILVWVPINESWGVPSIKNSRPQQHFSEAMYALTKAFDPTRPAMSNDGWEHTLSDLCTVHDYEPDPRRLAQRYSDLSRVLPGPQGRLIYAPGHTYSGEPVILSEFGGVAYDADNGGNDGWGYSAATDRQEYEHDVLALIRAAQDAPLLQGYCYTQFNDVEQEVNGLVTMDRRPKIDIAHLAAVNNGGKTD